MILKEIYLLSDDLVKTERFYTEILMCKAVSINHDALALQIGNTKLTFLKSTGVQPFYHLAFDIPNNQMEEAYKWIKNKTSVLPISTDNDIVHFPAWNAHSFYFYDNNESVLEFICRHDLDNQADKPFGCSSILNISELGIVTDDTITFSEEIRQKYGLQPYKLAVQDHFAAMGDDHGLLIIVNSGRDWFPTNKPAGKFWTKVLFSVEEKDLVLVTD
jgi:catechol-2,3-dioxygenase